MMIELPISHLVEDFIAVTSEMLSFGGFISLLIAFISYLNDSTVIDRKWHKYLVKLGLLGIFAVILYQILAHQYYNIKELVKSKCSGIKKKIPWIYMNSGLFCLIVSVYSYIINVNCANWMIFQTMLWYGIIVSVTGVFYIEFIAISSLKDRIKRKRIYQTIK